MVCIYTLLTIKNLYLPQQDHILIWCIVIPLISEITNPLLCEAPLYLTHWGWDKMAANFLMTFSNAFLMKIYAFWLRFNWMVELKNPIIGSGNGLALTRQQAIIWTNGGYFANTYMHHSTLMCYVSFLGHPHFISGNIVMGMLCCFDIGSGSQWLI